MLTSWEKHYTRQKSNLSYPDENLVRLLMRHIRNSTISGSEVVIDLGCGSGRHLSLLDDLSYGFSIGMDGSLQALLNCSEHLNHNLVNCFNAAIPLKDETADAVITWGSLHYNHKKELPSMINEILRILKPGGKLFATLRSDRDTYLRRGKHLGDNVWQTDLSDINGSIASFFSEEELGKIFCDFNDSEYGIMERSIIGENDRLISHWIISATR